MESEKALGSTNRPTFPNSFYDENYFENMAPNCRKVFRQSCGTKIGDHRRQYSYLAQLGEGMRVLDLGCGAGEFLMYSALRAGTEVWGVDYSASAIKLAEELRSMLPVGVRERVHLEQADCTNLDKCPDAFFDRIVWFSVIEHLYDWQISLTLKEAFRVLKTDGVFITETHPNSNAEHIGYPLARLILNLMRLENKPLKFASCEGGHINTQSPQSLRRHFTKAGYRARILVRSDHEYVNYPRWVKILGHFVRNTYPLSWIFGDEITVIAVKSPTLLQQWEHLIPHFLSQAVG